MGQTELVSSVWQLFLVVIIQNESFLHVALTPSSTLTRNGSICMDHINLPNVPGPTFGFVKLLASSGSHGTKWANEQHRPAGFESRLVPDLPLPFIPTLIGLRAFDLVSSLVWWETLANSPRGRSGAFVCGLSVWLFDCVQTNNSC